MKKIRLLSLSISLLIVCLATFIAFLFNTHSGLILTMKGLQQLLSHPLQIEKIEGELSSTIHLQGINYQDQEKKITIADATFSWKPLSLFKWQLNIVNLKTSAIHIVKRDNNNKITIKSSDFLEQFYLPQLPIGLAFENLSIPELQLREGEKQTFLIKNIQGKLILTGRKRNGNLSADMYIPLLLKTRMNITGNPNDYTTHLNLKGDGFDWEMVVTGGINKLVAKTTKAHFLNGKLNIHGEIDWENKSPIWKIQIDTSQLNLKKFYPLLLNFNLKANGVGNEGKLSLTSYNTRYGKYPISGKAILAFDYPHIQAFNANFHSFKNELKAEGELKDRWQLKWQASIPNLDLLTSNVQGSMISHGEISGERNKPAIRVDLSAHNLKTEFFDAESLNAKINLNTQSIVDSKLMVHAKKVKASIYQISDIKLLGQIDNPEDSSTITLKLASGVFQYPLENLIKRERFKGGYLKLNFTDKNIKTQLDLHLMGNSHYQGTIILPNHIERGSHQKIKGQIRGNINNLSFISGLTSPTIRNIKGRLNTQINLGGTIGRPSLRASLKLNAEAFMPEYNLTLRDISLNMQGNQKKITYQGQVRSKDTLLHLSGDTHFTPTGVHSKLQLEGDHFLVTNTPEIKIYASPKLSIVSDNAKTMIQGEVIIPKADIKPLDFSSITTMPEDTRYLKDKPSFFDQFTVESNILLTLGNDIHIRYEGLDGGLRGEVGIKDMTGELTTAQGQIRVIDGTYQLKGRRFSIKKGFLNFNGGPIGNPALDIQALRKIPVSITSFNSNLNIGTETIIVGVNITGTLRRHRVKLFSQPAGISQADILSYLLTGQSATSVTGSNLQLVLEAANALGSNSTSNFTDQIRQGLGLSEFSIQSDETSMKNGTTGEHTSLVLGKKISPRLYVNYAVGLLQALNTFRIRYKLGRNWILQGTANAQDTGADLIYSIQSKE